MISEKNFSAKQEINNICQAFRQKAYLLPHKCIRKRFGVKRTSASKLPGGMSMDQPDSLLTNAKYDVCITTITFFPDINATAKLMYDLAGDLADKGLKVVVLTQNRSYHDPNKIFPSFERIGGFDVIRVSLPSFNKNNEITFSHHWPCLRWGGDTIGKLGH